MQAVLVTPALCRSRRCINESAQTFGGEARIVVDPRHKPGVTGMAEFGGLRNDRFGGEERKRPSIRLGNPFATEHLDHRHVRLPCLAVAPGHQHDLIKERAALEPTQRDVDCVC